MAKGDEGRTRGHHLTPGRGWRWQEFGGQLMLVTDGGGADVVLSAMTMHRGEPGRLATCGPDGTMQRLIPDSPLGRLLAGLPALAEIALEICERDDRPSYRPRLEAALRAAGLL